MKPIDLNQPGKSIRQRFQDYKNAVDVEKYVRGAKPGEYAEKRRIAAEVGVDLAIAILYRHGYTLEGSPRDADGKRPKLPKMMLFGRSG